MLLPLYNNVAGMLYLFLYHVGFAVQRVLCRSQGVVCETLVLGLPQLLLEVLDFWRDAADVGSVVI